MSDDVDDFLAQKGTIELICEIGIGGARFNYLDNTVSISRGTISSRLGRGRELSLFAIEPIETENRTSHKYVLTGDGVLVWGLFEQTDLLETYHSYKQSRERFQAESSTAQEVVSDRYDELRSEIEVPDEVPLTLGQYVRDIEESQS